MTQAAVAPEVPPAASEGLPEASLAESAKFVATGLLPQLVRGLFSPRPQV